MNSNTFYSANGTIEHFTSSELDEFKCHNGYEYPLRKVSDTQIECLRDKGTYGCKHGLCKGETFIKTEAQFSKELLRCGHPSTYINDKFNWCYRGYDKLGTYNTQKYTSTAKNTPKYPITATTTATKNSVVLTSTAKNTPKFNSNTATTTATKDSVVLIKVRDVQELVTELENLGTVSKVKEILNTFQGLEEAEVQWGEESEEVKNTPLVAYSEQDLQNISESLQKIVKITQLDKMKKTGKFDKLISMFTG